jgi:predicted  nucleic acid-binding Zn-ribbon protein
MKNLRIYYVLAAIPPLFMLFGGILFREFILHAIHINPVLNLFIILVAVAGIALIIYNVYKVDWEYGKLMSFKARVDAGESMDALVLDKEYKGSEIGKVLVSVASTKGRLTSRIEQETIERSLADLHAHLEAKTEFPQFLTGFMIALGLLGTFIGLLETLVSTAALIDGFGKASQGADMDASFIHLVADLQKPLASMGTAFSASMFGLIGSLVLGFTLMTLRGAGKKLQTMTRATISSIVEHVIHDAAGPAAGVRPGLSEAFLGEFLGDLMVLQRESIMASRNASDSSMQAGLKLDSMNERLAAISTLFSESIDESKNMRQLVAVGPRMHETAQQTLEEIRGLGQMINQKMTSARDLSSTLSILEERLNNNGEIALRTFDALPALVTLMQSGQTALASALTSIQSQQSDASTVNEQTAQTMAQLPALFNQLSMRMADELSAIQHQGEIHATVAARLGELGGAISENSGNITRDSLAARQVQVDLVKHMAGQNNSIKTMAVIPETLTSITEALRRQNVMAQTIVDEMRVSRATIVKDVRLELREAVRELAAGANK